MPTAPRNGLVRSGWSVAKKTVFIVVLCELVLRGAFIARVQWATPPNCGVRPERLARLYFAYSADRPSPDPAGKSGVEHDPNRGFRLAPNLRGLDFHRAPLSTNSLGFRGTAEYPVPKDPSVTRVVALGDSFTFGEGVSDDATWPAQLQSLLSGTEVANLGAPAYAHDQMFFALRDDGMALQPDVVILGFYLNDKWRDELTFYCGEKPRLTQTNEGWQVENQPVPAGWDSYDQHRRLPLVDAAPRALIEMLVQPTLTATSGDERATAIIGRMRTLTESQGARFVLVNLPDNPDEEPLHTGLFYEFCATTGAECVDPAPQFRPTAGTDDSTALRAKFQLPDDTHYSRDGYAVVAESLRQYFAAHPIAHARP